MWLSTEAHRRAWVKADGYDNFNLIQAGVGSAERQCASGETERSVENFRALEGLIALLEEHRTPADEDE